jgi:predicted nucleic acid-binding protein
MTTGLDFVDTNILLYAHDRTDQQKQQRAEDLLRRLWATRTGAISTQVLQEFYSVATRRWSPRMERDQARQIVATYRAWRCMQIDVDAILAATDLEERHQLALWDALIVVAARRAGATRLFTEDLNHGQIIEGVRIVNPFADP